MHDQIAQHASFDVETRFERHAKTGSPAACIFPVRIVSKDVGLERGKSFIADFPADCLDAVKIGDCQLVVGRMVDPPGGAMRPVHADAVADLTAEQLMDRHAEPSGLGIEQRIFDRTHGERDDAAGGRARGAVEFGVDALVRAGFLPDDPGGKPLYDGAHAGCAEPLVEFAPADDAGVSGQLDEVVIAPAGVAGQRLDTLDFHDFLLDRSWPYEASAPAYTPAGSRVHATGPVEIVLRAGLTRRGMYIGCTMLAFERRET